LLGGVGVLHLVLVVIGVVVAAGGAAARQSGACKGGKP